MSILSELRELACDWLVECDSFEYEEDEEAARAGESDAALLRWVRKQYAGGLHAFWADSYFFHADTPSFADVI